MFRRGARCDGPFFGALALPRAAGPSRLGLAVDRRLGGAVLRNRAKRRLRECFRRCKPARALDLVLIAKREILDATASELEREFQRRIDELSRRGPRSRGAGAALRD